MWWRFVLEDLTIGLATGLVVGFAAAALMRRERDLETAIPAHQKSLYALGTAFAAYGIAVLPPRGNGLIAVYVAAITLGVRRPDLRLYFERQAEDIVEIVKLGIFVVFGSLLTLHGLFGDGWAAVAIVPWRCSWRARWPCSSRWPVAPPTAPPRAFMAWFGPKGVATMTFSLLVLSDHIAAGTRIFNIAALAVFCSIIAHGVSDTAGANWIARRAEREQALTGEKADQ